MVNLLEKLWRKFFGKKRISKQNRKDAVCDWCKTFKSTTENEIWCNADPKGYIRRLCDDCLSTCAMG